MTGNTYDTVPVQPSGVWAPGVMPGCETSGHQGASRCPTGEQVSHSGAAERHLSQRRRRSRGNVPGTLSPREPLMHTSGDDWPGDSEVWLTALTA